MDEKSGEQLQVKPRPSVEQPATGRHRKCLAATPTFARSTAPQGPGLSMHPTATTRHPMDTTLLQECPTHSRVEPPLSPPPYAPAAAAAPAHQPPHLHLPLLLVVVHECAEVCRQLSQLTASRASNFRSFV